MDPNNVQPTPGAPQPPTQPVQPAPPAGAPTPGPIGPDMPPSPEGGSTEPPKGSKKPIVVLLIVVVVAIAVAAAAYFLFMKDDTKDANKAAQDSTANVDATPIDELNSLTMNAPEDLKGYTDSALGSTTAKQFLAPDESCVLQFGTLTAEQLPGEDLADIVNQQIETVEQAGGTLVGPDSGEALLLKDATDESIVYSMPTLVFSYSKDDNRVRQYYSAAVLGNNDRAFVSRICGNSEGKDVPEEDLQEVNELAKGITITKL